MAYTATEESIQDGSPIELYKFSNLAGSFTYTSGNRTIEYQSETYEPLSLKRTGVGYGGRKATSTMTLRMPTANAFSERYLSDVPSTPDTLTIFRQHIFDGATETIIFWTGTVSSVTHEAAGVKVSLKSITAVTDEIIPRKTYSRMCAHTLYDTYCTVDKQKYRSDVIVAVISTDGRQITITDDPLWTGASSNTELTADAAFFDGGYVAATDHIESRMIEDFDNGTKIITVPFQFAELAVGDTLSAFAGCNHNGTHCFDKFRRQGASPDSPNIVNYGGFLRIPNDNPFFTNIVKKT